MAMFSVAPRRPSRYAQRRSGSCLTGRIVVNGRIDIGQGRNMIPSRQHLQADLHAILGDKGLLMGDADRHKHATDSSGWKSVPPWAVACPATTTEVSAVMALCNSHGIAVTPQGGLTGLAGGAVPVDDGLALSLHRMSGIVEFDARAGTLEVWAGTTLQQAQDYAEDQGFLLALDLGGRGSCQIGGNVSTNAGGNRVLRYGMTREQVLGLEAVLADGTVIDARNKLLKNNAGFDLKHLFIGTEGTLGVVTRITLRLRALPRSQCVALCGCARFEDAIGLLRAADSSLGSHLTAFEAMWQEFHDSALEVTPGSRRTLDAEYPLYVLIEPRGGDQARDQEALEQFLGEVAEDGLIGDAVVSQSSGDVARLWSLRDASGEIARSLQKFANLDVSVAIGDMENFI
ncbi:MAG TPA: FAD-binding oxidoreductase, partial [Rhodospirillales bacterium]|nr:FAD-binding oxidoreductase [Rhodospirillales bacterium]